MKKSLGEEAPARSLGEEVSLRPGQRLSPIRLAVAVVIGLALLAAYFIAAAMAGNF